MPHPAATPAAQQLLRDLADRIAADGVTLWVAGENSLLAVANPLEPEIVGLVQPLAAGLISQAFLTGQAMLEVHPAGQPAHDPSIDRTLGKQCRELMAAPLEAGPIDGVISAVKLAGTPGSFALGDLHDLVAAARRIETLLANG